MDQGEIYILTCMSSGKEYVGQASCFVAGKVPWGTQGRWKSHVRDAYQIKQNHCTALNAAIRKYGPKKFLVNCIMTCPLESMDEWEEKLIKEYNTLSPNGYNLNTGGAKGRDTAETRDKKRSSRLGKTHNDVTKKSISVSQIGNRRTAKKRKYEEDKNLPKYINAKRVNGKVIGYEIGRFPIGVTKKEYIKKCFTNLKNPKAALADALIFLEKLKKDYAHIHEKIEKEKQKSIVQKKKNYADDKKKKEVNDLPDNVYPLYEKDKKIGYYVEGLIDADGNNIPRKDFSGAQALIRNLNSANGWIHQCQINKENKEFVMPNLPTNLVHYTDTAANGKHVEGFAIKNLKATINGEDRKFNKKFTNMGLSMREKYDDAIEYYNSLKAGIIPETSGRKKYFRSH